METSFRSADLLRRLGSGVRPDGGRPAPGVEPIDGARFQSLLRLASQGSLSSGRPVIAARGAQLSRDLHDSELERLAQAADAAEALGVGSLIALVGERPMLLDVAARRVVRELRRGAERVAPEDVLVGVEAAVAIAPHKEPDEGDEASRAVAEARRERGGLSPLSVIDNPSVQEALAGGRRIGGSAD